MTVIKGKTTKHTVTRYFYFVSQARSVATPQAQVPRNINIADRSVELAPGHYVLHWECLGSPGSELGFTVFAGTVELAKVSQKIAPGDTSAWGRQNLEVPS
ncbi:MAG: hypothetical protein Q8K45_02475 [Rubrivivax sp.]|nr:hypothetical protein [Rubrivivax sp.]